MTDPRMRPYTVRVHFESGTFTIAPAMAAGDAFPRWVYGPFPCRALLGHLRSLVLEVETRQEALHKDSRSGQPG